MTMAGLGRRAKERRKLLHPLAKLSGRNPRRVVFGVVKDAEHFRGKELSHRECHAGEAGHEEIDGVLEVEFE